MLSFLSVDGFVSSFLSVDGFVSSFLSVEGFVSSFLSVEGFVSSFLPSVVVSAGLDGLLSSGSFAISSVFVSPQVKQVNVFTPVDVVVGAVVTSPSFHLCPVAFSVISSFVSSQVEQVYTVFPSFVQVAGVTFVFSQLCPRGCVTLSSLSPHSLQT